MSDLGGRTGSTSRLLLGSTLPGTPGTRKHPQLGGFGSCGALGGLWQAGTRNMGYIHMDTQTGDRPTGKHVETTRHRNNPVEFRHVLSKSAQSKHVRHPGCETNGVEPRGLFVSKEGTPHQAAETLPQPPQAGAGRLHGAAAASRRQRAAELPRRGGPERGRRVGVVWCVRSISSCHGE